MTFSLESCAQEINESPEGQIRREAIEAMMQAERINSLHKTLMDECTKMFRDLDELNAHISDSDQKMTGSTNMYMEGIQELKKDLEESTKLFDELMSKKTDNDHERNHLEVREKIDSVNQWPKERTMDIDDKTIKEEDSRTGFDPSAALEKEQDLLSLRNGSEDTDRSGKRQKLGHEEGMSNSRSSITSKKFTVLLVEYDNFARISNKVRIIQQFERNNYPEVEVKVTRTGQQAADLHRHEGPPFDLILMDMDMPVHVMSGPEAIRLLRSLGVESSIVGVTSESESEKIDEFIRAGLINGCIEKPPNVEKIASFLPLDSQQAITDPPQEDEGLIDP
ncbi:unnamed protein product [Dovyalis caffra]|uniref:Response regulatory domain-containing protein n=1 Tax=Dovyalis caffra TaxID=77055 RepID=A0AAV1RIY8_9ROSI|nr:unnamed protein product [Dovyalis caffra]